MKGRGALSNPAGRFEVRVTEPDPPVWPGDGSGAWSGHRRDDWSDDWAADGPAHEAPPRLATTVSVERARTIISRNASPDVPFDASINPYRGCEHGCIYCYARPSHSFLGLSPGIDFETRLVAKDGAAALLRQELAAPGYVCRAITIGANTDPYQPIERERRLTRGLLEVFAETRHPVALITKSALILRDRDLLADLARDGLARVYVSVTTLDAAMKRILEPRTASGQARLRVVEELRRAGIPAGVLIAPVIPAITDAELEAIVEAAAAAGAVSAGYIMLRLPYELKELFAEWLAAHFPERADKVMALVRGLRGGADNDPRFGTRMTGTGPLAELMRRRFALACRRHGLPAGRDRVPQRTDLFRPPAGPGGQQRLDF